MSDRLGKYITNSLSFPGRRSPWPDLLAAEVLQGPLPPLGAAEDGRADGGRAQAHRRQSGG